MRKVICLLLTIAFVSATVMDARNNAASAVPSDQASTERTASMKKKILELPSGTMIQVRLQNKQKVRGRLGQVDDRGFALTTAQQGKIETQTIAFSETKSFKEVTSTKSKAGHTVLYVLAGIGVVVLVVAIVFASKMD